MFRDIMSPRLLYTKAILLVLVGVVAAALLYMRAPGLETVALLAVCVFGFARAYYFLFYVLDRYVGTSVPGLVQGLLMLRKREIEHGKIEQMRVDPSVPDRD